LVYEIERIDIYVARYNESYEVEEGVKEEEHISHFG